ncbi:alpha-glucan water dikinase, partial [Cystoisospora suis]
MVHTNIGELINDFRAYLSILKDVHDALDIKKAFDYARQYLPHDAIGLLEGLVNELGSQRAQPHALSPGDAMGRFQRLAEGRKKILFTLNQGGGLGGDDGGAVAMTRELLFLDLALEQQQGVLLQGNASSLKLQELVVVLREMLLTASAHKPVSTELRSMYADWAHLGDSLAATASSSSSSSSHHLVEDSREAALLLKALADRVVRYVGNTIDDVQEQLGSKSVYLGNQVGTEKKVLDVFVDEVLRGSALFSLSLVVKRLEPLLRAAAMLPPWQLISIVERVQGELVSIDQLKNIQ